MKNMTNKSTFSYGITLYQLRSPLLLGTKSSAFMSILRLIIFAIIRGVYIMSNSFSRRVEDT